MKYKYGIGLYMDAAGRKPLEEYMFADANITDLTVMIQVIQRLAVIGQELTGTKMADELDDPIYELRKDRHRILYAPDNHNFILLSAFLKRTQKTPPKEIETAQARFEDYKKNPRNRVYPLALPPLD